MKKVSLLLAITLAFGLLAACSSGTSSSGSASASSPAQDSSASGGGAQGSGKDLAAVLQAALADAGEGTPMAPTVVPAHRVMPDFLPDDYDPMTSVLDVDSLSAEENAAYQQYRAYLNAFDENFTGFVEADMQDYAIQVSMVITLAYGVAIALPAEGSQQAVADQFAGYIEQNQKAQENYLRPQYEIALAAKVEVAPTGEVIMVMCKNSDVVLQNILSGLAA